MTPVRGILAVWMLLALMGGCLGCRSQPVFGVVERHPALAVGSFAYDIPFTTSDGKRTTLNRIRQPVTIVAFVDTPGDACCAVKSEVADLSAEFKRLPVTVVQVSGPTSTCAHSSGPRRVCHLKRSDPVVLCDRDRIAWDGFGRPRPETLILVDHRGIIAEVSDIAGLRAFSRKAEGLALEEMNRHLNW